ncbi:MAG: helix-turn-helix domain-containing protein [Actinomycetota bacterium]
MSWAGDLIRLARLECGLSQRELARRAGTSQATISAYEMGEKSPSLDTLARIVRAAGLDLRIQLTPADSHDEWLALYERSLPTEVVERSRSQDGELVERARSERAGPRR